MTGWPALGSAGAREARTWAAALLALGAAMVEHAVGSATHSTAVQAEALHMGAHASAFLLAALGYFGERRLAGRLLPAGRLPVVAALANSLLMLALAVELAIASWRGFSSPELVSFGPALGVAALGLIAALALLAMLHPRALTPRGVDDPNLRAVVFHMAGDVAVAGLAIAGLCAGRWLGWRWADGAAGLCGATLVLGLGLRIAVASVRRLVAPKPAVGRS